MDSVKYSPKQLHILGEKLREEDKLKEAVDVLTSAIVRYTIDKNFKGLVDSLQSRFLTWKHLFLLYKKRGYLKLAQMDSRTSLLTVKRRNMKDKLSRSYFRMGEAHMLNVNFHKAIYYYKKVLLLFKGKLSEKGNIRYHLGEALYESGRKKGGKEEMLKGLGEIEKGKDGIDGFVYHVWKSGSLLKLAELLKRENRDEAENYLHLAGKIIDSDERLIIRKRQFEELKKTF